MLPKAREFLNKATVGGKSKIYSQKHEKKTDSSPQEGLGQIVALISVCSIDKWVP